MLIRQLFLCDIEENKKRVSKIISRGKSKRCKTRKETTHPNAIVLFRQLISNAVVLISQLLPNARVLLCKLISDIIALGGELNSNRSVLL